MDIRKYIGLIRHWAWLVIVGAVVAGGLAYYLNARQTPVYQSTASYVISASSGSGSEYSNELYQITIAQTYALRMIKRPIIEGIIDELDLEGVHPSQIRISASVVPQTPIINVTVRDTDPVRAAAIANALGPVFSAQDRVIEDQRFAETLGQWQGQLDQLDRQIALLEQQITDFGVPTTSEGQAQLSRLERQLNEAQIQYTDTFNEKNRLEAEQARNRVIVSIIESAQPSGSPISPRTRTNTILAAVVGATAALGLIFLIEYLDDTVKSPEQVYREAGLSTLSAIAFIKGNDPGDRLITFHTPRAPISEAYRVLRTNLSFTSIDEGLQSLLITSSSPAEGKSTTSANLAVVMAQTGKRVIILDADLRRPSQHKIFSLPNNQGLTTALLDSATPVTHHLQETMVPGLRVMTSGPLPPNPAELLNANRMDAVLNALGEVADLVILDSPPALTVADAAILSPKINGVVLVVEVGETRVDSLLEAQERLSNANANVLGVILNRSRPARSGYYQYYYDYRYYAYDYSTAKPQRRAGLLGWFTNLLG